METRPYYPSEFPQSLRKLNQWVLWRYVVRDGKKTKVPFQTSGAPASSTDRKTHASFISVINTYNRGGYDGIGMVLYAENNLVGLDLDHVLPDPPTWARRILNNIDSYTTITPSGKGLRIIGYGDWPNDGNRKGGLEIYKTKRYLTFTPDIVLNRRLVNDITPGLTELWSYFKETKRSPSSLFLTPPKPHTTTDNNQILQRAFASALGDKIRRLWYGQIEYLGADGQPDHSRADLALCRYLAYFCDYPEQIDSLFRQSALYRPKWDEKRGSRTYGEMTIDKALR